MWLPDCGSDHTVVLLTPGKWAARWMSLRAVLMGSSALGQAGHGEVVAARSRRVPVGGSPQAESVP